MLNYTLVEIGNPYCPIHTDEYMVHQQSFVHLEQEFEVIHYCDKCLSEDNQSEESEI